MMTNENNDKMKTNLYAFCQEKVREQGLRIEKQLTVIQEGLSSETKSSAGDKHETGRAMLHLEREKLSEQLVSINQMNSILAKISTNSSRGVIHLGSLVYTSKGNYYISISAGRYVMPEAQVFCISAKTPMGKLLLGKAEGDVFTFNTESITILAVR